MSVIKYKYEVKIVRYIVQLACNIQVLLREILIDRMMSVISYHNYFEAFIAIEPTAAAVAVAAAAWSTI